MEVYASAIILLFCSFSGIVYAKSVLNIVDDSNNDVTAAISLKARIKNKKSHNDVNVSFESLIDVQDLHRIVNILVNSPYYVNDQANNENHGISLLSMGAQPLLGHASMPVGKCDKLLRYLFEAYQEVIETMQSSRISKKRIEEINHEKVDGMEKIEKKLLKHQIYDKIYDYGTPEEDMKEKISLKMKKIDSLFDHVDVETESLSLQEKIYQSIKELKSEMQKMLSKIYETPKKQQPPRHFNDDIDDDDEGEMDVENINLKNETGFIKNCSMVPIMQGNNSVREEVVTQNPTQDVGVIGSKVKFSDDESDYADYEEYPESTTLSSLGERPSLEQQIHEDRDEHLHGIAQNGTSESYPVKEAEVKKPMGKVSLGNSLRMIKKTSILRNHKQEGAQVRSWNKTAHYSGVVFNDKDDVGNKLSETDKKPIFKVSSKTDEREHKSSDVDGSHTQNQSGHVMEELIRAMQPGGRPQQKIIQPGIGNQNLDDFQNDF